MFEIRKVRRKEMKEGSDTEMEQNEIGLWKTRKRLMENTTD